MATTDPLTVIHLIDTLRLGGAERLLVTTVKHLNPARFLSKVVVLGPPFDLQPDLERLGVPVHRLGLRGPFDWVRGVGHLAGLLRHERPAILHTHLRYATFYGRVAGLLAGVPTMVRSLHSTEYSHWTSSRLRFQCRRFADRVAGSWLQEGYIAVSDAVRDDYARHLGLQHVEVIHNYVDVDEFRAPAPGQREATRADFGWTSRDFVLLHVARLDWEKGQTYLLQSMQEIQARLPEARLLLVGDGPHDGALRAEARALGLADRVVFAGLRQDLPALFQMADVFVFPSVAEGFGLALLEAMASGCAVVASRVEGIAEVIEDGVDGLFVPPRDPQALAQAVLRLHADATLRRALGQQARRTVQRRFSVATGIPRVEAVYQRLHRRSPGRQASMTNATDHDSRELSREACVLPTQAGRAS